MISIFSTLISVYQNRRNTRHPQVDFKESYDKIIVLQTNGISAEPSKRQSSKEGLGSDAAV